LYECEASFFSLKEERKLTTFEEKYLDLRESDGDWGSLPDEEPHNLL
jgi:hypothetical protein